MEIFIILYLIIIAYFFMILFYYIHFSDRSDILNNVFGFASLFFIFIHIVLFLSTMNQEVRLRSFFVPLWLLALGVPLIVVSLLILSSTTVEYLIRKVFRKDFSKLSKKFEEKSESWSKAKKDTLRKINHVFIFIGLFIIWYIGLFVVNFYAGTSAGMVPEENNMFLLYLRIIDEPNAITEVLFSLGWFYYLLFFFFYSFFLFMIANEFTRKSRFCSFPFNFFPKLYLSGEEKKNYGTYLYFTIGQMFAAFICPPMVLFSILGISSISDLVTSQIGIRFGKKHILWNQNKTWEGTIAGIITTFFLCLFFVGFLWSLIFTLLFLLFDIFTNNPINLSDNLLIPVGCSLTYIFIRFIFDLNYYTIFLSWF